MYRDYFKFVLFCVTMMQIFISQAGVYDIEYIDKRAVDKDILSQYEGMIKKIINNFDKLKSDDEKRKALATLGILKAEQAIPFLIKHLSFYPSGMKYTFGFNPAEFALILIGPSATNDVLTLIKTYSTPTNSNYNLKQRVRLLLFISRPRSLSKKISIMLIQNEIKKTTDKSILKNLKEAEKIINEWPSPHTNSKGNPNTCE